jgi:DNA helicase-2/ATP-dependent DNA helicase PcrA
MDLHTFYNYLAQSSARGYDLNSEQKEAVEHDDGPLWLLAGPGSGKSEVLVTRTLRLLCVSSEMTTRVLPRSIILTTFTKKAARNLEDRLATYLAVLQSDDASLNGVDLADMRVGTIHSLCNDILHEYRYPAYQNVRLLDDVDQHLFTYRFANIANEADISFWAFFDHAVSYWSLARGFPPNKWQRVKAAVILFNRLVEDSIDLSLMRASGGHWAKLADYYEQYAQVLQAQYRCDFAHLQKLFLEFVSSDAGLRLLDGDGTNHPPLMHVLVDEYQDTNPLQERIYLALAARAPHNLTVVGDDDQALYRFRGGTVSCMVNFDKACSTVFGHSPTQKHLDKNYRSHETIVEFFNNYIASFPEMTASGVRAPGKTKISAKSAITGPHPAVAWLTRPKARDLPDALAAMIKDHLLADGIIADESQCVILLRSTKDSPRNAGPFLAAFERAGIPVYNPRSKSFIESEEVQCLLAALIHVIDHNHTFTHMKDPQGRDRQFIADITGWIGALDAVRHRSPTPQLDNYIVRSNTNLPALCAAKPNDFLDLNLMEIIYRIIALEPFRTWRSDTVKNLRLSKVTRLVESYHSLSLDVLRSDASGIDLDQGFRNRFYNMFINYLIITGIDDDEDEEVIVPKNYLPLMTIHQAKGLEFPFVFVAQLGGRGSVGASQILERDLAPFRQDLYLRSARTPNLLALEDDIRLLYVAYSRAQIALILVGDPRQMAAHVAVPGRDFTAFRRSTPVI